MTKLTQILKSPVERMKLARQLSVLGMVVGVTATALLALVAVSGNM